MILDEHALGNPDPGRTEFERLGAVDEVITESAMAWSKRGAEGMHLGGMHLEVVRRGTE